MNLVGETTGIPEQSIKLKIIPNPAHDVIKIKGYKNAKFSQTVDIHGKIIKVTKLTDIESEINISSLSVGIYFLHIIAQEQWIKS